MSSQKVGTKTGTAVQEIQKTDTLRILLTQSKSPEMRTKEAWEIANLDGDKVSEVHASESHYDGGTYAVEIDSLESLIEDCKPESIIVGAIQEGTEERLDIDPDKYDYEVEIYNYWREGNSSE